MFADFYEILGIEKGASEEEIKRAYLEKVKRYHPDINPSDDANDIFLAIQEAFETLKQSDKRAVYDAALKNEDFAVPLIRYQIIPSCREIRRFKEDQLVYLLMEIECLKQLEEINEPQAHICLVVDQSTSMKGSRIEMVKSNISRMIKRLKQNDLISIVTFSDDAQIVLSPTSIKNGDLIESKINLITPSGGTEIKRGLKAGIDLLWQGKEKQFARYLVLLTDGHTYGDEEECYSLAKKAAKQGIKISALGIGHEWNDQFLDKLSSMTGGTSFFADSREGLGNYLESICQSLDNVYAQKMTLFVEEDQRFELKSLFQLEPVTIQFSNFDQHFVIGDLLFKKKSLFLMEFLVHPLDSSIKNLNLLKSSIRMELTGEDKQQARLFPELTLPVVNKEERASPPKEILKALSLMNMYLMQERTREDVQSGKYIDASRRLNYLGTRLISAGEVQLANKVFSESESIQRSHHFTLTGEKELKYGTKRLLGLQNT
jgi:Ca-activated chloride channel family protein